MKLSIVIKALVLVCTYYTFGMLQSCCKKIRHPFFDYSGILIINQSEQIQHSAYASFLIGMLEEKHTAEASININSYEFFTPLLALKCEQEGQYPKYPIIELNIYPDSIFHQDYKQGESITPLFGVSVEWDKDQNIIKTKSLDSAHVEFYGGGNIELVIAERPVSLNRAYTFTIEIVKENGVRHVTETAKVKWIQ